MIERLKGLLLCPLGMHTGHVRVDSDSGCMWFHCIRCGEDSGHRDYDPLAFRADGTPKFGEWLDE